MPWVSGANLFPETRGKRIKSQQERRNQVAVGLRSKFIPRDPRKENQEPAGVKKSSCYGSQEQIHSQRPEGRESRAGRREEIKLPWVSGAKYFLRDPSEPNQEPTQEKTCQQFQRKDKCSFINSRNSASAVQNTLCGVTIAFSPIAGSPVFLYSARKAST